MSEIESAIGYFLSKQVKKKVVQKIVYLSCGRDFHSNADVKQISQVIVHSKQSENVILMTLLSTGYIQGVSVLLLVT